LLIQGEFQWSADRMQILVAVGRFPWQPLWLPLGSGCVIASVMLFDSMSGFFGSSCEDLAEIEGVRDVAMATGFGITLAVTGL